MGDGWRMYRPYLFEVENEAKGIGAVRIFRSQIKHGA